MRSDGRELLAARALHCVGAHDAVDEPHSQQAWCCCTPGRILYRHTYLQHQTSRLTEKQALWQTTLASLRLSDLVTARAEQLQ